MSLKEVLKAARDAGWKVTMTGGGHWRLVPPDLSQPMVHTGSTPSDHRAVKNLVSQLRKSGLEI